MKILLQGSRQQGVIYFGVHYTNQCSHTSCVQHTYQTHLWICYSVCCKKKKNEIKNIFTVLGKNFPKVNYASRSCSKPSALSCCPFPLYSSQVPPPPISPVLSCPLSLLLVPSLATCSLRCLKPRASLVNSALWDLFFPRLSFPLSKINHFLSHCPQNRFCDWATDGLTRRWVCPWGPRPANGRWTY